MAGNPVADELSRLMQLRDAGVLTEAEFQAEKARLLAHSATGPPAPYWRPDLPLYRKPRSGRAEATPLFARSARRSPRLAIVVDSHRCRCFASRNQCNRPSWAECHEFESDKSPRTVTSRLK